MGILGKIYIVIICSSLSLIGTYVTYKSMYDTQEPTMELVASATKEHAVTLIETSQNITVSATRSFSIWTLLTYYNIFYGVEMNRQHLCMFFVSRSKNLLTSTCQVVLEEKADSLIFASVNAFFLVLLLCVIYGILSGVISVVRKYSVCLCSFVLIIATVFFLLCLIVS